jgi:hypothetical protein
VVRPPVGHTPNLNVGGGSYGVAMETTEDTTPLSTEDYWARMQALRDQLVELQQSAPAC